MSALHDFEREAVALADQWRSGDAEQRSAALDALEAMSQRRALALLADLARRLDLDQRAALADQLGVRWAFFEVGE